MGKTFRTRTKEEEKEDSKLYDALEDDISEIRETLKINYMTEKDGHEESIHRMVRGLDRIKDSLFTYVFDGHSASVTLEERDGNSAKKKPNKIIQKIMGGPSKKINP